MIGKQLLHRPTVRHALEQREVAEVRVREQALQAFQFFRKIIQLLRHLLNAPADRPVDSFRQDCAAQRQIAQTEQIQRGIQRLLRIVKALQQILRAQAPQRFLQIDQRLLGIFGKIQCSIRLRRIRLRRGR